MEKTKQGIRRALDAGLVVKVNMCLTAENAAECEEMMQYVKELGVCFGVDPFITKRYDGTDSSLDHRLDRATLSWLYSHKNTAMSIQPR